MAIITIFSASYCGENAISIKLATKLGYELINEKLIDQTAQQFQVSAEKLRETLSGHISFLNNLTHEKEKNIAYLKSILAQLVSTDNVIYHGFASHLLPKNITHILRVGIIANHEYRLKNAMNEENISEQNAKRKIKKNVIFFIS